MPFQLGLPEIILVLVIALVFLGPKRLPEAGQALGKGMREFRHGLDSVNPLHDSEPAAELPPAVPVYTPPPAYMPPPGEQAAVYTPPAAHPAAPAAGEGTRQRDSQ